MSTGREFFRRYVTGGTIVEIGSQDVNGSLRQVAPIRCKYVGVDCAAGKGVDIVSDPYRIPLPNDFANVVLSTSCFEHVEFFWELFVEMARITKPKGMIYLNSPSTGPVHRYPVDCWRFYPDAAPAMARWATRQGQPISLLETYTLEEGQFRDWVAIFVK